MNEEYKTITIADWNGETKSTKHEFVSRWIKHHQLNTVNNFGTRSEFDTKFLSSINEWIAKKAGEEFEKIYKSQNKG